jgi:cholesterol oxidase
MVLSGAGVGGGSLVYANTLYVPNPTMTPADEVMRVVAEEMGVGDTFHTARSACTSALRERCRGPRPTIPSSGAPGPHGAPASSAAPA